MNSPALANPRTPSVVAARKLLRRKHRDAAKAFLIEGPQAIREALSRRPPRVARLFATQEAIERHGDLISQARDNGVTVVPANGQAIAALTDTITPQGVVAIGPFVDIPLEELHGQKSKLVVVVAGIADPGNAGTILRVADAAGADAVVFADHSVDPYNGKCVRASAGSLFHLSLVR